MTLMSSREFLRPSHVRLEACSRCQLNCPACPTGTGLNRGGVIGWGHLRLGDFDRFLEDHTYVTHVELSSWGEIFLNPDLAQIIECAYSRGVTLSASGGVNLNHAKCEVLEAMVKFGFEHMDVSIDGATDRVYRQYRIGGNLDRVLSNVCRLNELKARYGSKKPVLTWKFVVFGHNEHEVTHAQALASELDMEFRPSLNFAEVWGVCRYSPVRDVVRVQSDTNLPVVTCADYRLRFGRHYLQPCRQLWDSPQVNWNGDLLGCCHNRTHTFGNVFVDGLEACLSGDRYRSMKAAVAGCLETPADLPCASCELRPD